MMLVVFVKKEHKNHISEIAAETVGTGLMNKMVSLTLVKWFFENMTDGAWFQFMHLIPT